MFRTLKAICLGAFICAAMTGCYNRAQNPYGYNNGLVAPPNYYNPYYQQQQPQQPYGTATAPNPNWQLAPAPATLSADNSGFVNGTVGTATYDQPVDANIQFDSPVPDNINIDESSMQPNNPPFPGQMPISQPAQEFQSGSRTILVPLNGQPVSPQFVNTAPYGYVPIDPGAIVMPQFYQQPGAPVYTGMQPTYAPPFMPTNHIGTTAGITVAQNSTLADHNAQWSVPR